MEMLFHETWCIAATESIQKERVRLRGNMSEDEMINRMGAQLSFYERLDRADRIINNNGTLEEFFAETEEILKESLKVPVTMGEIAGWKNVKPANLLMPRHDEGEDDEDDD
jgi:dephospho-CoA kinase